MKARIFKLGKSQYAVCKPTPASFQVYKMVRIHWQLVGSYESLAATKIAMFDDVARDGGAAVI